MFRDLHVEKEAATQISGGRISRHNGLGADLGLNCLKFKFG